MNGILLLDTILVTMVITLLLIMPLYAERKQRQVWQGRMKRAALRHCVLGNSEYGQARYITIGGAK